MPSAVGASCLGFGSDTSVKPCFLGYAHGDAAEGELEPDVDGKRSLVGTQQFGPHGGDKAYSAN